MDLVFRAGTEIVNAKIIGKKVYFKKMVNGSLVLQDLSKIKLPIKGILEKFPELKGLEDNEIRNEGAKRVKEHIAKMKTQDEIKNYIIKELESIGCKLISIVKPGHRPVVVRKNLKV